MTEILLRRGFLVKLAGTEILFSAGNTKDDIEYLNRFAISNPLLPRNDPSFPSSINFDDFTKEQTLSIIFHSPHLGITSIGVDKDKDPKKGFLKNTYGAKVSVECLDIGIASFIKALPLCSVRTRYCCDGHDKEFPHVDFVSEIHQNWFKFLVEHFFLQNGYLMALHFEYDEGHYRDGSVTFMPKDRSMDMVGIFSELHEASNLIRDEGSRKQILELKEKYLSEFSSQKLA